MSDISNFVISQKRKGQIRIKGAFRVLGWDDVPPWVLQRYPIETLEERARELYIKGARRFHPDLHQDNKDLYERFMVELNVAYNRLIYLLRLNKRRYYEDAMNRVV